MILEIDLGSRLRLYLRPWLVDLIKIFKYCGDDTIFYLVFPQKFLRCISSPQIAHSKCLKTYGTPCRCFHQFVSRIFPEVFFSVWAVIKEKKIFYWPKTFFSQFPSWKINDNKYLLKKILDSEFEIVETILWIIFKITFWGQVIKINNSNQ